MKRRALLAVGKRFERGRDMRRRFGSKICRVDHVGGGGGRRERGVDEVCRICMCKETKSMPFVHLGCKCKGSMAVVHKVGSDFLFLTETLF